MLVTAQLEKIDQIIYKIVYFVAAVDKFKINPGHICHILKA